MGWETVAWCEWNEFGQKVLKYHFPKATGHGDITKTDFTIYRGQCDLLTGGFPCQPYSAAGKRLGKEDSRHLWPEMCRAIREIQPTWVVGENVLGLVNWNGGMVFDEVQADLEAQGYEVQPYVLPACAVNAPHRRDRVWFVAKNTMCSGRIHGKLEQEGAEIREQWNIGTRDSERIYLSERTAADTEGDNGRGKFGNLAIENGQAYKGRQGSHFTEHSHIGNEGNAADTDSNGLEGSISTDINRQQPCKEEHDAERISMDGRGLQFANFPTQSPICSRDDGLSTQLDGITFSKWRNESIKAAGNAIVPQVALQIFKAIQLYQS
jgi:DNA (cytosine-5)-methyltransferase 1